MKFRFHSFVIASALLAALPVQAEPEPVMPGGGPMGPAFGEHAPHQMQQRLEQLHQALGLASAQEPGWDSWVAKLREARQERREARPNPQSLQAMTAIERMEKLIEFGKARQDYLVNALAATRTFYATLTPAQKKTFDDLAPFGAKGPRLGQGGPRPRPEPSR